MMKRTILFIVAISVLGTARAQAQQSVNLKEMPPIMNKLLMRGHRIELVPALGVTLNDEFTRSLLLQISAAYHINDWLGVGLELTYGAPLVTGLTEDIQSQTGNKVNRSYINILALPYISFTPFSGKFVVFDKYLGYADLHIDLGAGMTYVGGSGSKATWNAMFGVGMRYFPVKWLSIIVNFRDYLVPRQLNDLSSTKYTNNLAVLFGVGLYFPRTPKRTK